MTTGNPWTKGKGKFPEMVEFPLPRLISGRYIICCSDYFTANKTLPRMSRGFLDILWEGIWISCSLFTNLNDWMKAIRGWFPLVTHTEEMESSRIWMLPVIDFSSESTKMLLMFQVFLEWQLLRISFCASLTCASCFLQGHGGTLWQRLCKLPAGCCIAHARPGKWRPCRARGTHDPAAWVAPRLLKEVV